jgi:hypothetical protein
MLFLVMDCAFYIFLAYALDGFGIDLPYAVVVVALINFHEVFSEYAKRVRSACANYNCTRLLYT